MTWSGMIMGADPGLRNFGVAVLWFDGRTFRHVQSGCIETTKDDGLEANLSHLAWELEPYVAQVERIAYERPNGFPNARAIQAVWSAIGALGGAAALSSSRITIEPISVTMVKRVTGNPRADKEEVAALVRRRVHGWPTGEVPDHVTDAAAVALAALT